MIFVDRVDAGRQLAARLIRYRDDENAVVVGLPRGGVVTACEVAERLGLPLDVTCPKKIGAPNNPEYAIGAVTETGEVLLDTRVITMLEVSEDFIQSKVAEKRALAQERVRVFHEAHPPVQLKEKTVIIVDDGIATGFTMKASILSVRSNHPAKIVVAIPVSPPESLHEIASMVEEAVCLETPAYFQAVGQFYHQFPQTDDSEVIGLLERAYEREREAE